VKTKSHIEIYKNNLKIAKYHYKLQGSKSEYMEIIQKQRGFFYDQKGFINLHNPGCKKLA